MKIAYLRLVFGLVILLLYGQQRADRVLAAPAEVATYNQLYDSSFDVSQVVPVTVFKPHQEQTTVELTEVPVYNQGQPVAPQNSAGGSQRASGGANTYPSNPYQCTRYAKDMRPDVPNNLGDARFWFDELKALGWSTGYIPRAGALGVEVIGNHVVYVKWVNPDGSIHLSERNWDWNGSYRERDAAASLFKYVY